MNSLINTVKSIIAEPSVHKLLGLALAGFGAFGGPGLATNEHAAVTALGVAYAAIVHLVEGLKAAKTS